jgi:Fe-S-cluster containining protein
MCRIKWLTEPTDYEDPVPEEKYAAGVRLLRQPVLPLVSMLQFLYLTGPFATVAEVIAELPEPIETDRTVYKNPRALLSVYLESLVGLERFKQGNLPVQAVVDETGQQADPMPAAAALLQQEVLTAELERINSLLCGPCSCTLCCVGPEAEMAQEFFEIPLAPQELDLFPVRRHDSDASRSRRATDEDELTVEGLPFYRLAGPRLVHWQSGWSLILPRRSACPGLEPASGHCRIYTARPRVCRRPQIFPYVVEPLDEGNKTWRLRQCLLAITDCPYVRDLRDEIADYAAASSLNLVLARNKA